MKRKRKHRSAPRVSQTIQHEKSSKRGQKVDLSMAALGQSGELTAAGEPGDHRPSSRCIDRERLDRVLFILAGIITLLLRWT